MVSCLLHYSVMAEIISEEEADSASCPPVLTEQILTVSQLQESLITDKAHCSGGHDFLKTNPLVYRLKETYFYFSNKIHQIKSPVVRVASTGIRRSLKYIDFTKEISNGSVIEYGMKWIRHPLHIALLLWSLCVAVSGAMLILLLSGLLNNAFPTNASRNRWIEINNQFLNALFTLLSIYEHPHFCHHLFLLCRWTSHDAAELRKVYSKSSASLHHERTHIAVVVVFLHIACFCQYGECVLYWFFRDDNRPEYIETIFYASGVVAAVFAGLYMTCSPLGEEHETVSIEEVDQFTTACITADEAMIVSHPEWAGTMFECKGEHAVWYYSFFCTFCVFGWNMERLGFGNMYVHMVMFLLLCTAPFVVFNVSALRIRDYTLSDIVGDFGILLCFLGLLYGGYWRIQMRKKLGLPGHAFLCGSGSLSDYARWLFCWSCALAQEVRTANLHDAGDAGLLNQNSEILVDEEARDAPKPQEMCAVL